MRRHGNEDRGKLIDRGDKSMRATKWAPVLGAALVLAACGGEPEAPAQEAAAEALKPGLYEVSSEVTALASTDKTTPATKLKLGDKSVIKACVSADGKPAPELLAEMPTDSCEIKNSYIRYGRMSAQMSCKREGFRGEVMPAMMGSFTADGFEGEITELSYFIEEGDYRMTRKVSARRVGDCPPAGAAEEEKS
jgi:hypothetical protein